MPANELIYTRNCPTCGGVISYKGTYAASSRSRADKRNYSCKHCTNSGENNGWYGKHHTLKNKRLFAKNAKLLHTGRQRTDETKHNISVGIKNSNHSEIMRSEEIKNKLRKSNSVASKRMWKDPNYRKKTLDGRVGYRHSTETKQRMSESRVRYLKTQPTQPFQLQSKSATLFLDGLEKSWGKKIEREFELGGRFFDGKFENLLIEVDSKWWHSTPKQKRVDEQKNSIAVTHGFLLKRFEVNNEKDVPNILNEIERARAWQTM